MEICEGCNKERLIVNKLHKLCDDCNYKRLHKGLSKQQVYFERSLNKQKSQKISKAKYRRTGEKDLFLEIWEERLHVCVSCGASLGSEPKSYFFSHKKSKGSHPELRLDKENIELVCFDCHFEHEFGKKK